MNFLRCFLVLFLFLPSLSVAQSSRRGWSIDSVQAKLQAFFDSQNIQGMAVSISLDSVVVYSQGFGYLDEAKERPVNPAQSLFRIASLSKPITSTCLGVMVDQGTLAFDQSVYQYVPDFPKKRYDLNLQHLANHTSGIRHYRSFETENKKPLSIEAGLKKFQQSKLGFEPGTDYRYSSYGYNLLGVAMQNAAGMPFEHLVEEEVLEPLQMNHTIPDGRTVASHEVSGFFKASGDKPPKLTPEVDIFFKLPSGGYLSTTEDLLRLGNSYIYQSLLSEATQQAILTRPKLSTRTSSYAMGWGVSEDKAGRTYLSHSGGGVGAVTRIVVYPEQRYCIAVAINTNCDYLKLISDVKAVNAYVLENL
ncbi:MAG: serine hydrolase domain-containing protein [Bacteroidota bacterium]